MVTRVELAPFVAKKWTENELSDSVLYLIPKRRFHTEISIMLKEDVHFIRSTTKNWSELQQIIYLEIFIIAG